MNKLISLLAVGGAITVAASCGDNLKGPTDAKVADTSTIDTPMGFPAAPTLGAQIDRMGRPAINTALNDPLDPSMTNQGSAKDAYNADESAGTWQQTWAPHFAAVLGIYDVLDRGLSCTMGSCSTNATADGCGNQVYYNGTASGGGTPMQTSYLTLAGILADDQLYLDTTQTTCDAPNSHANYLAVEFNVATGLSNTCGGRAPTNDVIDTSYTVLAVGINGFSATMNFQPFIGDGVGPHANVSNSTFPFLEAPH